MEYHALFIDPYSANRLNTTASWYIDGRNFGPTLAAVRELMDEAGVQREEGYHEPEDSIEVLMDTMMQILRDAVETGAERPVRLSGRLFAGSIMPLAKGMISCMEELREFPFYRACASFMSEWLELERESAGA